MEVQLRLQPFSLELACPDGLEFARQDVAKKHRRRYLELLTEDHLWPRHEGALYIEKYPIVTHVGSISVCWDRKPMSKNLEGKAVFDIGGAIFKQGEDEDSLNTRKVRKQLGW
jgi:hypothetical protein